MFRKKTCIYKNRPLRQNSVHCSSKKKNKNNNEPTIVLNWNTNSFSVPFTSTRDRRLRQNLLRANRSTHECIYFSTACEKLELIFLFFINLDSVGCYCRYSVFVFQFNYCIVSNFTALFFIFFSLIVYIFVYKHP